MAKDTIKAILLVIINSLCVLTLLCSIMVYTSDNINMPWRSDMMFVFLVIPFFCDPLLCLIALALLILNKFYKLSMLNRALPIIAVVFISIPFFAFEHHMYVGFIISLLLCAVSLVLTIRSCRILYRSIIMQRKTSGPYKMGIVGKTIISSAIIVPLIFTIWYMLNVTPHIGRSIRDGQVQGILLFSDHDGSPATHENNLRMISLASGEEHVIGKRTEDSYYSLGFFNIIKKNCIAWGNTITWDPADNTIKKIQLPFDIERHMGASSLSRSAGKIAYFSQPHHRGLITNDGYHIGYTGIMHIYDFLGDEDKVISKEITVWNTPLWSPDEKRIIFTKPYDDSYLDYNFMKKQKVRSFKGRKKFIESLSTIYIYERDDGSVIEVGRGWNPTWGPLGRKIACMKDRKLVIYDTVDRSEHVLSTTGKLLHDSSFTWSPDGKYIAYTAKPSPFAKRYIHYTWASEPRQLWFIALDGSYDKYFQTRNFNHIVWLSNDYERYYRGKVLPEPEKPESKTKSKKRQSPREWQASRVESYTKIIERDPKSLIAHVERGKWYAIMEEYENAMSDYNKAIELDPNNLDAYSKKAELCYSLKQYDKAIEACNKYIELTGGGFSSYRARAYYYMANEQNEEAVADFDKCIQLSQGNDNYLQEHVANAYLYRGRTNAELGKYKLAIEDLNRAIELDEYKWAYFYKGKVCDSQGLIKDAIKAYKKFIERAPSKFEEEITFVKKRIKVLSSGKARDD